MVTKKAVFGFLLIISAFITACFIVDYLFFGSAADLINMMKTSDPVTKQMVRDGVLKFIMGIPAGLGTFFLISWPGFSLLKKWVEEMDKKIT